MTFLRTEKSCGLFWLREEAINMQRIKCMYINQVTYLMYLSIIIIIFIIIIIIIIIITIIIIATFPCSLTKYSQISG